jgi:hypothetical protein
VTPYRWPKRLKKTSPSGMRMISLPVSASRISCARGAVGIGQNGVFDANLLQHAENIGPELDARADLTELWALFEDAYRCAEARQYVGSG